MNKDIAQCLTLLGKEDDLEFASYVHSEEGHLILQDQDLSIIENEHITMLPKNFEVRLYHGAIPSIHIERCPKFKKLEYITADENGILIKDCALFEEVGSMVRISSGLELDALPNFTTIAEDLVCEGLKLLHVPKFTFLPHVPGIRGDISIEHAVQFEGIHSTYEVIEGSLSFVSCPKMYTLPERLSLSHDFYLKECDALRTLPQYFKVGGTLNLDAPNSIEILPEVLMVGGSASLRGCKISQLPKKIAIGGDVYIHPKTEAHIMEELFAWKEKGMIRGEIIVA